MVHDYWLCVFMSGLTVAGAGPIKAQLCCRQGSAAVIAVLCERAALFSLFAVGGGVSSRLGDNNYATGKPLWECSGSWWFSDWRTRLTLIPSTFPPCPCTLSITNRFMGVLGQGEEDLRGRIRDLNTFMTSRNLPKDLQGRVRNVIQH